jgi:hypothetical protein
MGMSTTPTHAGWWLTTILWTEFLFLGQARGEHALSVIIKTTTKVSMGMFKTY